MLTMNATSFKQLNISENKIEDPISVPILRTSQGPTPQTLLSKMQKQQVVLTASAKLKNIPYSQGLD